MDMDDVRDKLTVTRRFPNGAVTAQIVYRVSGSLEWTIVVFPTMEDAEMWAKSADMEYAVAPEVQLQLRALQDALNGG
jgi:hypothetical protein